MRTLTCSESSETIGINASGFANNLRGESVGPVMHKYGLDNLGPEEWFPTRRLLDALNELSGGEDFGSNLVAIGLEIGMITPVAPGIDNPSIEDVLMAWDGIYQYIHRNADVGKILCEKISDQHFRLTFTDLYPDDFSFGILHGYGRRFIKPPLHFTVYYDEAIPPRDWGGTQGHTVIHFEWE